MNYRDFLQKLIYAIINPLIHGLIKLHVTPNMITTLGFLGNIGAAACFIYAALALQSGDTAGAFCDITWGGGIILFAGLFDMIDGRLARLGNMSTTFGAMWDSVLDRYSELISLFGVVLIFLLGNQFWLGVVSFTAMIGSVMVSYVRARAEGLGIECKVGLMQRPERVVVLAFTAIASGLSANLQWLAVGMIIIAILANITAFWRIGHCYKALQGK